jgi:hypothetical protein
MIFEFDPPVAVGLDVIEYILIAKETLVEVGLDVIRHD